MKTLWFVALIALVVTGCVSQRPAEQAYIVDSRGAVSAGTRSALNGSTAPGAQEIIGLYLPFPGTGLAIKAGVEWDGTPRVIEVPMAAPAAAPQVVTTQRTVMVPETRTIMVPRVIEERRVTVPVPPQVTNPCPEPVGLKPAVPAGPLPESCDGVECAAR